MARRSARRRERGWSCRSNQRATSQGRPQGLSRARGRTARLELREVATEQEQVDLGPPREAQDVLDPIGAVKAATRARAPRRRAAREAARARALASARARRDLLGRPRRSIQVRMTSCGFRESPKGSVSSARPGSWSSRRQNDHGADRVVSSGSSESEGSCARILRSSARSDSEGSRPSSSDSRPGRLVAASASA